MIFRISSSRHSFPITKIPAPNFHQKSKAYPTVFTVNFKHILKNADFKTIPLQLLAQKSRWGIKLIMAEYYLPLIIKYAIFAFLNKYIAHHAPTRPKVKTIEEFFSIFD